MTPCAPPAPRERASGPSASSSWHPTGSVLDEKNIAMVLDFAREHGLAVLADEVYQENIYLPGDRFVSFAHVLEAMGISDVSLFSFNSCSKGFWVSAACAAATSSTAMCPRM